MTAPLSVVVQCDHCLLLMYAARNVPAARRAAYDTAASYASRGAADLRNCKASVDGRHHAPVRWSDEASS